VLPDLASYVPNNEIIILEAIQAFFSDSSKDFRINKLKIVLTNERLPAFKRGMENILQSDQQNFKAPLPLKKSAGRRNLYLDAKDKAKEERERFEIRFPLKIKDTNKFIFDLSIIKSLAKDMNEKTEHFEKIRKEPRSLCDRC